jgi:putative ATPase
LGSLNLQVDEGARELLLAAADGDARRMLNLLETAADLSTPGAAAGPEAAGHPDAASRTDVAGRRLDGDTMRAVIGSTYVRFDKGGENFYDQISALHKSVRGSDPDAALYWLCRMLAGGCDPLYVARRALRMASEDIGNADPRALTMALEACAVYERLGSPEGELAIAQAIVFMACAAKSNAVYAAFNAATEDATKLGSLEVPLHLRNAPTRLMKDIGYGKGYRYAHDEPGGYAAGERYFPDEMPDRRYYVPVTRGLEIKIGEALAARRARDAKKQETGKP